MSARFSLNDLSDLLKKVNNYDTRTSGTAGDEISRRVHALNEEVRKTELLEETIDKRNQRIAQLELELEIAQVRKAHFTTQAEITRAQGWSSDPDAVRPRHLT